MPEFPLTPDDVRKPLFWLLTIEWASRIYRFATDAVNILDSDGNILVFQGGLAVQFTESMNLFSPTPGGPSLTVTGLQFPDDVAELIEKGHPMVRVPAELSLHVDGETLEKRKVRFKGRLRATDYGEIGEPVSFTVTPRRTQSDVFIPDEDALVLEATWPDADEPAIGKYYPTVIGRPGFTLGGTVTGINAGSPAAHVDTTGPTRQLLVAGHAVVATSVQIIDQTDLKAGSFATILAQDTLGRDVTVVTISGAVTSVAGNEYWTRWNATGGALPNPFREGVVLEGAGDVIRFALNQAGVEVDHGRWAAVSDELNGFLIAGYLDEPIDLPRWLEKEIYPLLPITVLDGPSGPFPVLWNRNVQANEVVADIVVDRDGLSRQGPVRYEDDAFGNTLRIRYAFRSDGGAQPFKTRTLTGRDVGAELENTQPASHLRSSRSVHGPKERKPLKTAFVYDDATALRILAWQAAAYAFPWRFIDYRDDAGTLAWLRPGDAATLTDDGGGSASIWLTNRVCWLQSIRWDDIVPTYTFVLIDSPSRDVRPT